MAQPTATQATNDTVGIREDLVDVIYDVSPVETPVISSAAHTTATSTTHEWQTDALAAAANNAAIEGDDATASAVVATTRLTNLTQISDKVARVSGTARAVDTAGRADELAYQKLKRGRELKRDMEKVVCDNKAKVAGNDTLARQCAGIPAYVVTNISEASDATTAAGTGADAHTDGTARRFTETLLKSVQKLCFDNGGNPDVLMTGGFNRQIVSSFGGDGTKVQKAEDPALHASFDVYDGDFGELRVVPNRFMEARTALLLDMDMLKIPFLTGRNMVEHEIAKTGDSDSVQILSEYTVEVCNGKAHGAVYDLTTS